MQRKKTSILQYSTRRPATRGDWSAGKPIAGGGGGSCCSLSSLSRHAAIFLALLFLQIALLLLFHFFPPSLILSSFSKHSQTQRNANSSTPAATTASKVATSSSSTSSSPAPGCDSGLIYVYDLPTKFNYDLLEACDTMDPWRSLCPWLSNEGYGTAAVGEMYGTVPDPLLPFWFNTNQYSLEPIFHHRLLKHRCRTEDPSAATAFYVPFYAGLAIWRYLFDSNFAAADRDRDCADFLSWLQSQPSYRMSSGWDHFIAVGRSTWDFRRSKDGEWGSSFFHMPGVKNVTRLLVERNPWDDMEVGVPYPIGFHPKSPADVAAWARFVLAKNRTTLFAFAATPRPTYKNDFRQLLFDECAAAGEACEALKCGEGNECINGAMRSTALFLRSQFCLQPRGDAFSRQSMFECMLAGAVPVLFWRRSAYMQYQWYMPGERPDSGKWSVFIDHTKLRAGKTSVKAVLEGIGEERARAMREKVVEMLPKLLYSTATKAAPWEDAVDVAVDGILARVREQRRQRTTTMPEKTNG